MCAWRADRDEWNRFRKSTKTPEERFWEKVDKSDECWVWTGYRNRQGYGNFSVRGENNTFTSTRAHRYAWQLVNGDIPTGMFVCHRCDTPSCVRPDHMFLGTQKDNLRDAVAKGRHASQRNHYHGKTHRKLSAAKVLAIRAAYTGRYGQMTEMAREYGVVPNTIRHVLIRKIWRQI